MPIHPGQLLERRKQYLRSPHEHWLAELHPHRQTSVKRILATESLSVPLSGGRESRTGTSERKKLSPSRAIQDSYGRTSDFQP